MNLCMFKRVKRAAYRNKKNSAQYSNTFYTVTKIMILKKRFLKGDIRKMRWYQMVGLKGQRSDFGDKTVHVS